jgi:hypothetical protein
VTARRVVVLRLGVHGERLGLFGVDCQGAPQAPLDDDRAGDRGSDPELPDGSGDRPGNAVPVIDPGGSACLEDQCRRIALLDRQVRPNLGLLAGGGPGRYDGHRVVGLVAGHPGEVRAQQPPDLFGDGAEELARRHTLCDQRRHTPQRGLLVGEPPDLRSRLGVRDRRSSATTSAAWRRSAGPSTPSLPPCRVNVPTLCEPFSLPPSS